MCIRDREIFREEFNLKNTNSSPSRFFTNRSHWYQLTRVIIRSSFYSSYPLFPLFSRFVSIGKVVEIAFGKIDCCIITRQELLKNFTKHLMRWKIYLFGSINWSNTEFDAQQSIFIGFLLNQNLKQAFPCAIHTNNRLFLEQLMQPVFF